MTKEEFIQYLKDNLRIRINTESEYGPSTTLRVTLTLEGEEINDDFVSIYEDQK